MKKKCLFDQYVDTILHGADYNPEQWQNYPDIVDKDIAMMQQAKCNIMSVGIFSWAKLEPAEGVYEFKWLDVILDKLAIAGISVFLATPSGARPAWMSQRYPQVMRVSRDRVPALHGGRHNHCLSSPVYRKKTLKINTLLAERYSHHPRSWAGISLMNMAVSAIVACASSNFVSGLKNVTKRWMRLIMPGGAVSESYL
jgi:beta-galactosidase